MAQTLQELCDTIIMPLALDVLRENIQMPQLVAQDYKNEATEHNSTIRTAKPQNLGKAKDFDPNVGSSSSDLTDEYVDVKMDQWKYQQFKMNDKEIQETKNSAILPSAVQSAVKALANSIDESLLGLYKDIPYYSGTAGVTPSTSANIISVRKILQKNLAPVGNRRLVVDVEAEEKFIDLYKDVDKTGDTAALREASIGRKFGFETYCDQLVPLHTKGSVTGTTLVAGAVAQGETVMNIDGAGANQTLKKGDLFTIGVFQLVVAQDITANGAGVFTGVTFYPPAPVGGFADNAPITFVASHTPNLAFQRDAFKLVVRPLPVMESKSSTLSIAVDPISGLPLRIETWRDPSFSTQYWKFDILFGVKTMIPELAARLIG